MAIIFAVWVIIVLAGIVFFSLFNITEYGFASLFLAGLSSYGLYKVFKLMYEGYKSSGAGHRSSRK